MSYITGFFGILFKFIAFLMAFFLVAYLLEALSAMQSVVGGDIQAIYPFDETVALICHEEGKFLGLPLNRALYNPDSGECYDIIAGTFLLCAAPVDSEQFESLFEAQVARYLTRFYQPEAFLRINGCLICFPIEDDVDD